MTTTEDPTIHDLEALDRGDLIALWQQMLEAPPPRRMSQVLMRRILAFEIQARAQGGLPARVRRALGTPEDRARPRTPGLQPGGRLLREWGGRTHVVDVIEDGFVWGGETYRSLSIIARRITGAHWSGPRFFGLGKGGGK